MRLTQPLLLLRHAVAPRLDRMLARLGEHVHEAEQRLVTDPDLGTRAAREPAVGRGREVEREEVLPEQRLLELARKDLVQWDGERFERGALWADEDELGAGGTVRSGGERGRRVGGKAWAGGRGDERSAGMGGRVANAHSLVGDPEAAGLLQLLRAARAARGARSGRGRVGNDQCHFASGFDSGDRHLMANRHWDAVRTEHGPVERHGGSKETETCGANCGGGQGAKRL